MNSIHKTIKVWDKNDYLRTAVLFVLAFFGGLIILLAASYLSDSQKLLTIIKDSRTRLFLLLIGYTLICAVTYVYFYFEHRDFLIRTKNIVLTFTILYVSLAFTYLFGRFMNTYARPIAACALFSLILIGRREAVFINFIYCLLLFLLDAFLKLPSQGGSISYISPFISFIAGMTAIYTISGTKSRVTVLLRGLFIAAPIAAVAAASSGNTVLSVGEAALWGLFGGITSVVIFLILLPVFEASFNVVTNYRLYELTNHDSKLLTKLREVAPGTFNHSIVVANMAEACAAAIGENGNLARAAAYYHDIGKMAHPECFSENTGGGRNPHDELTPELSTEIIRSHTKEGYSIIKKHRLPEILGDICMQHHGTMVIKFFYAKAKKMTEGELNPDEFSYFGPKPQTKIAAIIMLSDACEARMRTLATRSPEGVEKGVDEIFEERMEAEQFNECQITMAELEVLRKNIINALTGIYHDRVKYPRLKLKRRSD